MLSSTEVTKIRKTLQTEGASLSSVFAILGDSARYKIIELLSKNSKLCVTDLASILDMSLSCVSQHLRILEMSGLVDKEREGQRICYTYRPKDSKTKAIVDLISN